MRNDLINLKKSKYVIYGFGKTGKSVKFFLKKNNIKSFFVWDDNWISKKANKKVKQIKILSKEIINSDYIVISPGIQISKAIAKNILKRYTKKIITDLDIFYLFYPNLKTIMVTGTNGKSTTCELLKNLFQKTKKYNVHLSGNIGRPILYERPKNRSLFIIEASSYQLYYSKYLRPNHALIINISNDHLDWHINYSNYLNSKLKIFQNQKKNNFAYLEDLKLITKFKRKKFKGKLITVKKKLKNTFVNDIKTRYFKNEANLQNLRFVYTIANKFKIRRKIFFSIINSFKPLPHRGEYLVKKAGVVFINDSKATSFEAAKNSLSIHKNIFWILGGVPKKGEKINLSNYKKSIIKIYLIGKNISFFENLIYKKFNYKICHSLKRAFLDIKKDLKKLKSLNTNFSKTVLLCPASASFDQFQNFEERGSKFKRMVKLYA